MSHPSSPSISRRNFLEKGGIFAGAVLAAPTFGSLLGNSDAVEAAGHKPVYLGTSIRSLANPYGTQWNQGGELFNTALHQSSKYYEVLTFPDDAGQVNTVQSLISKAGKDVVFNFDPNDAPVVKPLADALSQAGVYFATQWNKPDNIHPWNYDPYWVCHITDDGLATGYDTATQLFQALKPQAGVGKVFAINGLLGDTIGRERFAGLKKALKEFPHMELVGSQPANWDRQVAYSVTQTALTAHPDINAIWSANDDMAIGALKAISAAGKTGKIAIVGTDAIPEALAAIRDGHMVATVASDAMWQGGMGLSLAYHAYTGVIKPASLPRSKREWYFKYFLITRKNVQEWINHKPNYNWNDLFGRDTGRIR